MTESRFFFIFFFGCCVTLWGGLHFKSLFKHLPQPFSLAVFWLRISESEKKKKFVLGLFNYRLVGFFKTFRREIRRTI
jgi:hypothetical protein